MVWRYDLNILALKGRLQITWSDDVCGVHIYNKSIYSTALIHEYMNEKIQDIMDLTA